MLKRFFSGAKLGIISKSDGFRYFPNDFLIKRLVFLHRTEVSRSHLSRSQPTSHDKYQKNSFIKHVSGKQR